MENNSKILYRKYAENIFYPNLKIDIKNKLPTFYKDLIKVWEQISVGNPLTMENVMVQPIKYNGKILVNRSVIVWKEASDLFVQNFYGENGDLMGWEMFKQKNGKNDSFFFKWRQILDAIPRDWKDIVRRDVSSGHVGIVTPEPHLQVISRRVVLAKLTGKETYIMLINGIWEKPTSEGKIEQMLGESNLIWSKIYMLGRKITLDSYSRQFHFKARGGGSGHFFGLKMKLVSKDSPAFLEHTAFYRIKNINFL